MAAASYTTDLTDIFTDTGNFTLISSGGGGQNALTQPETDDYIQGSSSVSRNPWSSSIRGLVDDNVTAITVTAGDAIFIWTKADVAQALATKAAGGIQCMIGNSTTALNAYYVDGSDTYLFGGWKCYAIDPRTGTITPSTVLGTPNGTIDHIGVRWSVPADGPSKGFPFKVDAIRHGRTFIVTDGDLGNGYATFVASASTNNTLSNQYGLFQDQIGSYLQQGLYQIGTGATSADFRDSNRVINIANTEFVISSFNGFEINNASTNVEWTNINISALGTVARGNFVINNNAVVSWDACTFTDVGTFSLGGTNTSVNTCTFRRTDSITLNSSTLVSCLITNNRAASSVIGDGDLLDACTFESDGSNHALEITAVGDGIIAWNSIATGYATGTSGTNVTTTTTGNEHIYLNFTSTATFTINVTGGGTIPSVRKGAGMTGNVDIVQATLVTLTGLKDNSEIRVMASGSNTVELAGIESAISGTINNRSFSFSLSSGTVVDIYIVNVLYENQEITGYVVPSSNSALPIQQRFDRSYRNP